MADNATAPHEADVDEALAEVIAEAMDDVAPAECEEDPLTPWDGVCVYAPISSTDDPYKR